MELGFLPRFPGLTNFLFGWTRTLLGQNPNFFTTTFFNPTQGNNFHTLTLEPQREREHTFLTLGWLGGFWGPLTFPKLSFPRNGNTGDPLGTFLTLLGFWDPTTRVGIFLPNKKPKILGTPFHTQGFPVWAHGGFFQNFWDLGNTFLTSHTRVVGDNLFLKTRGFLPGREF